MYTTRFLREAAFLIHMWIGDCRMVNLFTMNGFRRELDFPMQSSELLPPAESSQVRASTGTASDGIGRSRMAPHIFPRKPTTRRGLSKVRLSGFSMETGTKFAYRVASAASWTKKKNTTGGGGVFFVFFIRII